MRPLALAVSGSTSQRWREDGHGVSQRWLRGDLRVPTCFPFFVKRGKKCFSSEVLRLTETSKFKEKAEVVSPDDSSKKQSEL